MAEETVLRPIDPAWPEARKLALIQVALNAGMPWAAVARALKVATAGEAKKIKRELERKVRQRQLAG